jgi:hypothetical protein
MADKHTPGPWRIVDREILEDGSVYPEHIIGGVTELQICLLEASSSAHAYVYDPAWSKRQKSQMSEANARLIAAAPDLLEALLECLPHLERDDQHIDALGWKMPHYTKACEAIAKATGSKP